MAATGSTRRVRRTRANRVRSMIRANAAFARPVGFAVARPSTPATRPPPRPTRTAAPPPAGRIGSAPRSRTPPSSRRPAPPTRAPPPASTASVRSRRCARAHHGHRARGHTSAARRRLRSDASTQPGPVALVGDHLRRRGAVPRLARPHQSPPNHSTGTGQREAPARRSRGAVVLRQQPQPRRPRGTATLPDGRAPSARPRAAGRPRGGRQGDDRRPTARSAAVAGRCCPRAPGAAKRGSASGVRGSTAVTTATRPTTVRRRAPPAGRPRPPRRIAPPLGETTSHRVGARLAERRQQRGDPRPGGVSTHGPPEGVEVRGAGPRGPRPATPTGRTPASPGSRSETAGEPDADRHDNGASCASADARGRRLQAAVPERSCRRDRRSPDRSPRLGPRRPSATARCPRLRTCARAAHSATSSDHLVVAAVRPLATRPARLVERPRHRAPADTVAGADRRAALRGQRHPTSAAARSRPPSAVRARGSCPARTRRRRRRRARQHLGVAEELGHPTRWPGGRRPPRAARPARPARRASTTTRRPATAPPAGRG